MNLRVGMLRKVVDELKDDCAMNRPSGLTCGKCYRCLARVVVEREIRRVEKEALDDHLSDAAE